MDPKGPNSHSSITIMIQLTLSIISVGNGIMLFIFVLVFLSIPAEALSRVGVFLLKPFFCLFPSNKNYGKAFAVL
jgi:hypothetical protein